jgi:SAM-dependent MidA family methyltransferase
MFVGAMYDMFAEVRNEANLPPLTADEASHSRRLVHRIWEEIDACAGWLSFERFMEMALYEPGLGYYSAGATKLGAGGDFVTAPEVSSLFSRCLATQCGEILQQVSGGSILELGAGSGVMAADLLNELAAQGALPERYLILEVSADLRERQRALIQERAAAHAGRVEWLDALPQEFRGVVLANEVLDALPFHRFALHEEDMLEIGVGLSDAEQLVEALRPAEQTLREALIATLPELLPDGYASEICLRVHPWIASLAAALDQGIMLLFDYGLPRAHYYHPQRDRGTLRCHFRHRAHEDPLINVGMQDITAWVDFTRVADAALAAGLDVPGFSTQAAFLLASGIDKSIETAPDDVERARRASEARQLLMPGEMGEAFKVMALARGFSEPLRGFSLQDLRDSL